MIHAELNLESWRKRAGKLQFLQFLCSRKPVLNVCN